MAVKSRAYLKSKFESGDIPTQQDYIDLLDTFFSLYEGGTITQTPVSLNFPAGGEFNIDNEGGNTNERSVKLDQRWIEITYRDATEQLFSLLGIGVTTATRNIGGIYFNVAEGINGGGDPNSGIAILKDGTIDVGDLSNAPTSTRFKFMQFKHDYSDQWDALSDAEKLRKIFDHGYNLENFLSKLDTSDQTVASNVEFKKKVGFGTDGGLVALADVNSSGTPTTPVNIATHIENSIAVTVDENTIAALQLKNLNNGASAEMRFIAVSDQANTYMAFTAPGTGNTGEFFGAVKSTGHFLFSTGDRDLYIGNLAANRDLVFGTNNAKSVRIKADGNTVFGADDADTKVEVAGAITSNQIPEPTDPDDGKSVTWTHDGSGVTYGIGDIVTKSTVGITTKAQIDFDYSAL